MRSGGDGKPPLLLMSSDECGITKFATTAQNSPSPVSPGREAWARRFVGELSANLTFGITSRLPVIRPESVTSTCFSHPQSSSGGTNLQRVCRIVEHPTREPLSPRPAMRRALGGLSPANRTFRCATASKHLSEPSGNRYQALLRSLVFAGREIHH